MSKKAIVIIGDWFIDENWLVSKQKLYHSSHTGDIHFLARHESINKRIINLCGAAEIMEVLRPYLEKKYQFIGFGAWNPLDDLMMKCVLCLKHQEEKLLIPYTLTNFKNISSLSKDNKKKKAKNQQKCIYDENEECKMKDLDLINIANVDTGTSKINKKTEDIININKNKVSTNRIIRCFEGFAGGKPNLLYRLDWILPIDEDKNHMFYDENFNKLKPYEIEAIIIEDHGMGVINEKCINSLKKQLNGKLDGEIKWFVRTKIANPKWFRELPNSRRNLSLTVLNSQLAVYQKGERRWFYGKALGRAALELLGEMTGESVWLDRTETPTNHPQFQSAAVLLDENIVFAKENEKCFSLSQLNEEKQILNIGRTTIFYSALIAQKIVRKKDEQNVFGLEISLARDCAVAWSKKISQSWNTEEALPFFKNYNTALKKLKKSERVEEVEVSNYRDLWKNEWNPSSEGLGIIQKKNRRVLQLWRGEGILPGYICVGGPKRDAINHLVSVVGKFYHDKNPNLPLGCLLIASPGWGKSFLAHLLAKKFGIEYLEFSIAQMATTHDLLNCLATIASVQNRTKKKTLVFIDEIDARIEGHFVFNLLLSPLWDGSFVIDGKNYRLEPGIWIFASTTTLRLMRVENKGSDMISRLNGPIIELDKLSSQDNLTKAISQVKKILVENPSIVQDIDTYQNKIYKVGGDYETYAHLKDVQIKTEQVYLMVSLLITHWGPINKIQKCVLQMFHDLLPINGIRSMEIFAAKFEGIRRGEVTKENVPNMKNNQALLRHVILPKAWLSDNEDDKGKKKKTENSFDKTLIDIEIIVI